MIFLCPCGAEVEASAGPPRYCPSCARGGTFSIKAKTEGFPHSYKSPVLSAAALRARGRGLVRLPEPWSFVSDGWGFPFLMNIYGEKATGKSTLALALADTWGGRAIFLSLEEGLGATLAERVARMEVMTVDFGYPSSWGEVVSQIADYSLVVIDSLQMLKASSAPATIRAELVDRASKNVIVTSQVNSTGEVRGGKAIGHFADVQVHLPEYGKLLVEKNRYGEAKGVAQWREL